MVFLEFTLRSLISFLCPRSVANRKYRSRDHIFTRPSSAPWRWLFLISVMYLNVHCTYYWRFGGIWDIFWAWNLTCCFEQHFHRNIACFTSLSPIWYTNIKISGDITCTLSWLCTMIRFERFLHIIHHKSERTVKATVPVLSMTMQYIGARCPNTRVTCRIM